MMKTGVFILTTQNDNTYSWGSAGNDWRPIAVLCYFSGSATASYLFTWPPGAQLPYLQPRVTQSASIYQTSLTSDNRRLRYSWLNNVPGLFVRGPQYKTSGNLNETPGNLNETSGDLNETSGNLNETPGDLNETSGDLNETIVLTAELTELNQIREGHGSIMKFK